MSFLSPFQQVLARSEWRTYSQSYQDGVLAKLFELLGTSNREFVEFGFNANSYEPPQSGANTRLLYKRGWRGLLMDGGHENATINLQRANLGPHTIGATLNRFRVRRDVDYISIDFDSYDAWTMLSIVRAGYQPRVFTVEYNPAWVHGSTMLQKHPTKDGPVELCAGFGTSLIALEMLAKSVGYRLVYVVSGLDAFLVRGDLVNDTAITPIAQLPAERLTDGHYHMGSYKRFARPQSLGSNPAPHLGYWGFQSMGCTSETQDAVAYLRTRRSHMSTR